MIGSTRALFNMSSTMRSAPFSRAVFQAMRALYPEELAEKSWDNTGLLLEAPFDPLKRQKNSVLLTIDLTKAVADEAIERKDSVIVAYHPIIFRGLKSLTMDNSQQQSLLRLAAAGISVYSPHTALDAAKGGINDWLADIVTGVETIPSTSTSNLPSQDPKTESSRPSLPKRPTYQLSHYPSQSSIKEPVLKLGVVEHTRSPIQSKSLEAYPDAGLGKIVRFLSPQLFTDLIDRIGRGIGSPKGFAVAVPQGKSPQDIKISSVAICAGSGGSILSPVTDVDLLFTGELQHHEALAAIERGQSVVTLFHSNTERGFLHTVLRDQLKMKLKEDWEAIRTKETEAIAGQQVLEQMNEALDDEDVDVHVSERDRDPFGLVFLND